MSDEIKSFDWPRKVRGGYLVGLVFKTMDDALVFLKGRNLIGDNSAEYQVDQWAKQGKKDIEREATWLKKAIKRFFGNA